MTTQDLSQRFATVAVIGAGTMGAGIAQLAATHGHKVLLFDLAEEPLEKAMTKMMASLSRLVTKGKFTEQQVSDLRQRIVLVTDLASLADADIVIEAIVEDLAIKRKLFSDLEGLVDERTVLASNTSSLSISALARGMAHPSRFVGMHFFNPAPVMKLVEVIAGIDSDPAVLSEVQQLATSWRKVAVQAKSTPGFIVNRVARPYYAEALRLVEEGFGSPATIDTVLTACGGFRMGPFALTDLIGHDVNYAVTESVYHAFYQDSWFKPSLVQKDLVDAGHLGRKSGKGFYHYSDSAAKTGQSPSPSQSKGKSQSLADIDPSRHAFATAAELGSASISLVAGNGALAPLQDRLRACCPAEPAERSEQQQSSASTGAIAISDGDQQLTLRLTDGMTADQQQRAEPNRVVMLIDLAADFATAEYLHVACSTKATEADRALVARVFAKAGIGVIFGADSPGMVVMRTVAMLANLGYDAVFKGVCSAEDVDNAMRFGVNYPKGPLSWAQEVGLAQITATLQNLYSAYHDDRYRSSYLLSSLSSS